MHSRFQKLPLLDRSSVPGLTLGGVWFAGVSLGLLAARFLGDQVADLTLTAARAELSFSDACVVTVLPLFLSAFAVFFFHRFGVYLACAVRAVTIGFLLGCLTAVGGLWFGLLLGFSGLCSCGVLLWFLWRRLGVYPFLGDSLYAFAVSLAVSAVDTWVVAPFLARALSF